MVRSTLAHALTNYHVSKYGHRNHDKAVGAKLVNKLLFTKIWRQKWHFAYQFLHRRRSCHHVFVRIRNLYGDKQEAIYRCKSLLVHLALLSANVTYCALRQTHERICSCLTAASSNLASSNYFLVKKSLAALAIFKGQFQHTPYALRMLSVQVPKRYHPFVIVLWAEPWIRMCHTSYLSHRISRVHLPIPVVSIRQASSASAETSPCAAVPF